MTETRERVEQLTAQRTQDAIDGQAALDQTNNTIAHLQARLAEVERECTEAIIKKNAAVDRADTLQREHAELKGALGKAVTKPKEMQDLMRKHGLKIDNLDDSMQKLAFTFYTELCELSREAENVLEHSARPGEEA